MIMEDLLVSWNTMTGILKEAHGWSLVLVDSKLQRTLDLKWVLQLVQLYMHMKYSMLCNQSLVGLMLRITQIIIIS